MQRFFFFLSFFSCIWFLITTPKTCQQLQGATKLLAKDNGNCSSKCCWSHYDNYDDITGIKYIVEFLAFGYKIA